MGLISTANVLQNRIEAGLFFSVYVLFQGHRWVEPIQPYSTSGVHLPVGPPFPRCYINSLWSFSDLDWAGFTWTASFTSKLALVTGIDRPGRELNQPHWSNSSQRQIQLGARYGFMRYYSRSRQKVIGSDGLQHQCLNKWTVEAIVSVSKFWLIHAKKKEKTQNDEAFLGRSS